MEDELLIEDEAERVYLSVNGKFRVSVLKPITVKRLYDAAVYLQQETENEKLRQANDYEAVGTLGGGQ